MTDRRRQRQAGGSGGSGAAGAGVVSAGNAVKKSRRERALNLASNVMIASDDEEEDASLRASSSSDDDDDEEHQQETTDARKVRLAREYLQAIEKKTNDDDDDSSQDDDDDDDHDEDEDEDRIGAKLRHDRLKQSGMLQQTVANKVATRVAQLQDDACQRHATAATAAATTTAQTAAAAHAWIAAGHVKLCKGHDLTLTSVALQADGCRAISGSKDHSVILWDVEHAKRISYIVPHWKKSANNHTSSSSSNKKDSGKGNDQNKGASSASSAAWRTAGQVLSVACSDDGRLAAVGARNGTVRIFDLRKNNNSNNNAACSPVQTFTGHKGPVTALSFRTGALELFSASQDRCIRHYNLQESSNMMYLETLYGHQFGVTDIDCHLAERPVSVGMDRTARGWRLAQDTHLIFRGGSRLSWAESVSLVRNDWFVTGHVQGELALWNMEKKRAVTTLQNVHHGGPEAHLNNGNDDPNTGSSSSPHSVICVRALKESDLAATGSNDGYLRFWKVQTGRTLEERGIRALCQVPLVGYLNDICIGPEAKFAVVATGQEHRLGRFTSATSSTSSSSSSSSALLHGAKNRLAIVQLSTNSSSGDNAGLNDSKVGEKESSALLHRPAKDNEEEEEETSSDNESSSSSEDSGEESDH